MAFCEIRWKTKLTGGRKQVLPPSSWEGNAKIPSSLHTSTTALTGPLNCEFLPKVQLSAKPESKASSLGTSEFADVLLGCSNLTRECQNWTCNLAAAARPLVALRS